MNSSLVVLVADPYRTELSCAVLGCLQQAERRRSGSRIKFVFSPTETPEPGFLKGANGAVLVLLQGQRAAAETMVRFWEKLTNSEERFVPALPIFIRTDSNTADPGASALPISYASVPVAIAESDILIEHGGLVSLSHTAETEIEQALNSVFRKADSTLRTGRSSCCPALRN